MLQPSKIKRGARYARSTLKLLVTSKVKEAVGCHEQGANSLATIILHYSTGVSAKDGLPVPFDQTSIVACLSRLILPLVTSVDSHVEAMAEE